jgi:hypothetical protein
MAKSARRGRVSTRHGKVRKEFWLDPKRLLKAQEILGTATERETVELALDLRSGGPGRRGTRACQFEDHPDRLIRGTTEVRPGRQLLHRRRAGAFRPLKPLTHLIEGFRPAPPPSLALLRQVLEER